MYICGIEKLIQFYKPQKNSNNFIIFMKHLSKPMIKTFLFDLLHYQPINSSSGRHKQQQSVKYELMNLNERAIAHIAHLSSRTEPSTKKVVALNRKIPGTADSKYSMFKCLVHILYLSSLLKPFLQNLVIPAGNIIFFLIKLTIFTVKDNKVPLAFIQGTRTGKDDPWTVNSGNLLPYLPATVGNSNDASSTKLLLNQEGFYAYSVTSKYQVFVLCEI